MASRGRLTWLQKDVLISRKPFYGEFMVPIFSFGFLLLLLLLFNRT